MCLGCWSRQGFIDDEDISTVAKMPELEEEDAEGKGKGKGKEKEKIIPCCHCLVVVFGIRNSSAHVVVYTASRTAPSSPVPDRVDEDGAEEKDAGML
ncbi:hypothetical protein C8R45DRAFT_1222678, partial [Mycena sanguinolenta]